MWVLQEQYGSEITGGIDTEKSQWLEHLQKRCVTHGRSCGTLALMVLRGGSRGGGGGGGGDGGGRNAGRDGCIGDSVVSTLFRLHHMCCRREEEEKAVVETLERQLEDDIRELKVRSSLSSQHHMLCTADSPSSSLHYHSLLQRQHAELVALEKWKIRSSHESKVKSLEEVRASAVLTACVTVAATPIASCGAVLLRMWSQFYSLERSHSLQRVEASWLVDTRALEAELKQLRGAVNAVLPVEQLPQLLLLAEDLQVGGWALVWVGAEHRSGSVVYCDVASCRVGYHCPSSPSSQAPRRRAHAVSAAERSHHPSHCGERGDTTAVWESRVGVDHGI